MNENLYEMSSKYVSENFFHHKCPNSAKFNLFFQNNIFSKICQPLSQLALSKKKWSDLKVEVKRIYSASLSCRTLGRPLGGAVFEHIP